MGGKKKSRRAVICKLMHRDKPGKVTVPVHKGDIPKGTLHAILKQAGLK